MPTLRELKRRYKVNLALGRALPTFDMGVALPLSTGNALFDAALTEKLSPSTTLTESDHVARLWHLVRSARREELDALATQARGLMNDAKLLLALRAWQDGDDAGTRAWLRALPWGWRLGFPTAVIKPARTLFTGWRRGIEFRLVEPRFDALRALFRELLAEAPGVALQKYRASVRESAALLKYRFEGERERGIHDFCFGKGGVAAGVAALEPIGTTLRARDALRASGPRAFLDVLEASERSIPITSFMGLLGAAGLRLRDSGPHHAALRSYAVRTATVVESILRLTEWSPWLDAGHVRTLSDKVRHAVVEGDVVVPFHKIVRAFNAAPPGVKKLVHEPLVVPLLRHFGKGAAALLPAPGPVTFLMPGNVIHLMSLLLYAVVASAMPARLLLLFPKGVQEVEPVALEEVCAHLADGTGECEAWLLERFGGLATHNTYTYDYAAVRRALAGLDPAAPLVLDLPFSDSVDVLEGLLPFERVLNLNNAYGAPGEVCLAQDYYLSFFMGGKGWSFSSWARFSDRAAEHFAEMLDRLARFQALAEFVPEHQVGAEVPRVEVPR
jgi:hypothetical protein